MHQETKRNLAVFGFFFILACLFRLPAFFLSVIDPDDSVYLLMARSLLDGSPPYIEVWDHKPPGIYLLFLISQVVLGKSIFAIRMLACVAVACTSYVLYRLGKILVKDGTKLGLIAGILYITFSSRGGALTSNTEIFYIPFVTVSFYLLFSWDLFLSEFRERPNYLRLLTIGLLMGLALQIKQVVIFDLLALTIILTVIIYTRTKPNTKHLAQTLMKAYAFFSIGVLSPLLLILTYFAVTGYIDIYIHSNFLANIAYGQVEYPSFPHLMSILLKRFDRYLLLWFCLFAMPIYFLFTKDTDHKEKKKMLFVAAWLSAGFLSLIYTKRLWNYYFLQLLPSLSLISSYMITRLFLSDKVKSRISTALILFIILGQSIVQIQPEFLRTATICYYRYIQGIDHWGDTPAKVSSYLRQHIDEGDYIYVVDHEPIIYYLSHAKTPTKFVLPWWIVAAKNSSSFLGVDPIQELRSILSKHPLYIIKMRGFPSWNNLNMEFYAELDKFIQRDYILETTVDNAYIFKIKINTL